MRVGPKTAVRMIEHGLVVCIILPICVILLAMPWRGLVWLVVVAVVVLLWIEAVIGVLWFVVGIIVLIVTVRVRDVLN